MVIGPIPRLSPRAQIIRSQVLLRPRSDRSTPLPARSRPSQECQAYYVPTTGAQTRVHCVPWFEIVWNTDILLMLYPRGRVWFRPHHWPLPNSESRRRYCLEQARAVNANGTLIVTSKHTGIWIMILVEAILYITFRTTPAPSHDKRCFKNGHLSHRLIAFRRQLGTITHGLWLPTEK
jgi:hypothetical protein